MVNSAFYELCLLNGNVRDPYIPVVVADVDLPQPVALVRGRGKHFEPEPASGRFGLVRIAAVQAKLNPCTAKLSGSDCAAHWVVLEGMIGMQYPLRPIPGADGEIEIGRAHV